MFSSVYLKTLYNLRGQILGWSLGVGFVAFITMMLYDSFDKDGIESIISSVPESLKPLVGSIDDFKTIPGFIGQQIFGPNTYILTVAAVVILALSISANEEDDKRLQTLLTLPVTRTAVFLQKWLAVLTAIIGICIVIIIATYIGLIVTNHSADTGRLLESTFACFLMNATFASIAFGVAMFTGKKGLSITLAGGYATFCFIISSLAPSVDGLKNVDTLSVLHYYNNPQVMQHGLTTSHTLILIGVTLVVIGASWLRFRSRNVGV